MKNPFKNIFKKNSPNKLSKVTEKKLKEIGIDKSGKYSFKIFKSRLLEPSIESIISFTIILSLIFLFVQNSDTPIFINFLIDKKINPSTFLISQEDSHFQNIISIIGGIGAIVVGLVFFIIGVVGNDRFTTKTYFHTGRIWPLSFFSIGLFLVYSWIRWQSCCDGISILALLPILIYAISTISALYKILDLILKKERLEYKTAELVISKISESIENVLYERIMFNLFYGLMESSEYIFSAHGNINDENKQDVYPSISGILIDINLKELRKLSNYLNELRLTEKLGYPQNLQDKKVSERTTNLSEKEDIKEEVQIPKLNVFLFSKIQIGPDEIAKPLLTYDKRLLGTNIRNANIRKRKITKMVTDIFIIGEYKRVNNKIMTELLDVEKGFVKGIKESDRGLVKRYTKLYKSFVISFIQKFKETVGSYNNKKAHEERTSLIGGWDSMEWLSDSTRLLIDIALKENVAQITQEVTYLPKRFIQLAIEQNDAYVYQHFLRFVFIFYHMAKNTKDSDIKQMLEEKTVEYIQDLSTYNLEVALDKAIDETTQKEMLDYVKHMYIVLQTLTKNSFDDDNWNLFERYIKLHKKLFRQYKSGYFNKPNNYAHDINISSELVIWALSSYILSKYISNSINNKYLNKLLPLLPNKITDIINLYMRASDERKTRNWDWDTWDRGESGEVISIKTQERFTELLAFQLMKKFNNEIEINNFIKDTDPGFINNITELIKTIQSLNNRNINTTKSFFNDTDIKKTSQLILFLEKVKDHLEKNEKKTLREEPVSQSKVKDFRQKVLKYFNKHASFRYILKKYDLLNIRESTTKPIQSRGYNEIVTKKQFIDNWRISHSNMGDYYGESLANWENTYILDKLYSKSNKKNITEVNIKHLLKTRPEDKFIIAINQNLFELQEYDTNFNTGTKEKNIFKYIYSYKSYSIPVYNIYTHHSNKQGIFILDVTKLGKLTIYTPKQQSGTKILNNLSIGVFNNIEHPKVFNSILKKHPDWLEKQGTIKQQKNYLHEHVIVKVFEKVLFKTKSKTSFWGYFLSTKTINDY